MGQVTVSSLASAWEHMLGVFDPAVVAELLGADVHARLRGRLLALSAETPAAASLDVIPSETTPGERRLLAGFFAHLWAGRASVLEIGPFLGGTTRAIGRGMLCNPQRSADSRLCTYDRFEAYHEPGDLAAMLEPLVAAGALERDVVAAMGERASFRDVFRAIHAGADYAPLLRVETGVLPSSPPEEAGLAEPLRLEPGRRFDAVFVDGCKSWYGTRAFFRTVAPALEPHAHVIFQDYGWFTCYFIPAFVHLMGDAFAPLACVDATYAFELARPLDPREIEAHFPDEPAALGVDGIERLFDELARGAMQRSDTRALVFHELQRAHALQALGERDAAARVLGDLAARPLAPEHGLALESARKNLSAR